MPEASRWFLDTVVLSNFALAGRLDLLETRYGRQGQVTQEALDEISDGIAAGYAALGAIEEAVTGGALTAASVLTARERPVYRSLLCALSSGEASCIACAEARGGVVATDDRAARNACADRAVAFTGTIGILRACCLDGSLEPAKADAVLDGMVRSGFYAPVQRVSDLL